ncbi:60 kDa jasmonate-induced protein-like [Hordeum vulgare]|nr:60 kDa jasmonate-induced protein-like [Hordeum vulgare]
MQKHDISFAGFTDGSGDWHAFPGLEHLFPASTTLPFGSSYSELIGGVANLPGVTLGRNAIRVLAAYRPGADVEPGAGGDEGCDERGPAGGAHIRKTVDDGWVTGARVAPEHLPYVEHWDTMSYEILRTNRTGKWDGPFTKMLEMEANIRSKEEALAVVGVLRNADFEEVLQAHATPI